MQAKLPPPFQRRREVERYFSGDTIECLICGRNFQRLQTHLAAKHGMTADEYKSRFGLPWARGLLSATSLATSGWTDERKARARKLARKSRFFESARLTPRREFAPFLKAEAVEHLGANAKAFGEKFDARVHALARAGARHPGHCSSTQGCTHHRTRAHQAKAQRQVQAPKPPRHARRYSRRVYLIGAGCLVDRANRKLNCAMSLEGGSQLDL